MKIQIPEELKRDVPQTTFGKILAATPIIMTVLATLLAGLASSEMTRAQYARALAAQQQAKAGDQWGYFQAKRLRSSMQRTTLDLIVATTETRPLEAGQVTGLSDAAAAALLTGTIPPVPADLKLAPALESALRCLEDGQSEEQIASHLLSVDPKTLIESVRAAHQRADTFDDAAKPINQALESLEKSIPASDRARRRDVTAARARYTAARYDAEARLNQSVAQLIELQVRKSNTIAERHHRRSQRFFLGMLAAQAGVIVSTFSLAARQRSMLWTLAAVAGLAAIGFAIYVYFYV